MTTPSVAINAAVAAVTNRKVYLSNGSLQSDTDLVVTGSRFSRNRPASVNNPKRSDGTRRPASWVSYGGVIKAGRGFCFLKGSGLAHTDTEEIFYALPSSPGLAIPNAVAQADARVNALRKALGHFSEAEAKLGVTLRETKETCQAVRHYYSAASKGVGKLTDTVQSNKSVREKLKRFLSAPFKNWKQAPSEYLGYLYGVRPLADEVSNAVEVLTQTRDRGGQFNMYLRGKFSSVSSETRTVSGISSPSNFRLRGLSRLEARASLHFKLPAWYWDRLPPVTFFRESWETTRLSFVLDWVLPVKSWLIGFEGTQLRPFFYEGSTTVFVRFDYESVEVWTAPSGSYITGGEPSGMEYFMQRIALTSFPTGELLLRPPRFRSALQLDKLDDAAALLGQRLVKLSRALN